MRREMYEKHYMRDAVAEAREFFDLRYFIIPFFSRLPGDVFIVLY